jgi:tetratricopeptide (TPR) repeat protein
MQIKYIFIIFITVFFFVHDNYSISEVVILKDGNKYIGPITDEGAQIKITTPDGELLVKKERIKAIYKDAQTVLKETTDVLVEAQTLIAGANKIENRKERNTTLDKAIGMLSKAQDVCLDVLEVFSAKDGEAIARQFKEINSTIRHANTLKVLETPRPSGTKEPGRDKAGQEQPDRIDKEKLETAMEFYNFALSAFINKQYEKARDLFIKTIYYNPHSPEAYAKLGEIYTLLKDEELAYEYYEQSLENINSLKSPTETLIKLRETILVKTKKFREIDEKISSLNKEFASNLMKLADECIQQDDFTLAEDVFSLILQVSENKQEAYQFITGAREKIKEKLKDGKK